MASSKNKRTQPGPILDQISPFNEARFDDCMAYLSQKHERALTQYDMVKLHLMTDFFHSLERGKPVIGGPVEAWDFGPVVPDAYNRIRHWTYKHDEEGFQPDALSIVSQSGKSWQFQNSKKIDPREFSQSELDALDKAWKTIMKLTWNQSQEFFHGASFVGRAWSKARAQKRNIDWQELIDEYDKEHGTDHKHIKVLLRF